jgi:hypothetical protein
MPDTITIQSLYYLIIQRNKKITVIWSTIRFIFQNTLLCIKFHLKKKTYTRILMINQRKYRCCTTIKLWYLFSCMKYFKYYQLIGRLILQSNSTLFVYYKDRTNIFTNIGQTDYNDFLWIIIDFLYRLLICLCAVFIHAVLLCIQTNDHHLCI